jgi:CO dehydrogenase maturation factor
MGAHEKIIAICGKGGVGKTAFTSMMVKVLLENGKAGKLLVIDADPALGLSNTLGISIKHTMGQIRETVIDAARKDDTQEMHDIVNQFDYMVFEALVETDNFAFLAMGRTEAQGCFCPLNSLLRSAIGRLAGIFDVVLIDGEAGLEQINRQVVKDVDKLIVLTDTSFRGRETVAHIKKLIIDNNVINCKDFGVVFNRVQSKENEKILYDFAEEIGIQVFGAIPQDKNIEAYDLIGRPLIHLPADSPALSAIRAFSVMNERIH